MQRARNRDTPLTWGIGIPGTKGGPARAPPGTRCRSPVLVPQKRQFPRQDGGRNHDLVLAFYASSSVTYLRQVATQCVARPNLVANRITGRSTYVNPLSSNALPESDTGASRQKLTVAVGRRAGGDGRATVPGHPSAVDTRPLLRGHPLAPRPAERPAGAKYAFPRGVAVQSLRGAGAIGGGLRSFPGGGSLENGLRGPPAGGTRPTPFTRSRTALLAGPAARRWTHDVRNTIATMTARAIAACARLKRRVTESYRSTSSKIRHSGLAATMARDGQSQHRRPQQRRCVVAHDRGDAAIPNSVTKLRPQTPRRTSSRTAAVVARATPAVRQAPGQSPTGFPQEPGNTPD